MTFFLFDSLFFLDEVEVKFSGDKVWLANDKYITEPLVVHGNGASKVCVNYQM